MMLVGQNVNANALLYLIFLTMLCAAADWLSGVSKQRASQV